MPESGIVETVLHAEVPRAATRTVVTGRARLQRVVVHERRTIEVDVAHEEYRLVQDDADGQAAQGSDVGGTGPRTVSTVLHEERIEIVRSVVPVERVTLVVEAVAGEQRVLVPLRHETVELDREAAPTA